MSWAQHEKDFVINYLKTTFWNNCGNTLFSDKSSRVWKARWNDLSGNFDENANALFEDCDYCRFRGWRKWKDDSEWNILQCNLNSINGYNDEIANSGTPDRYTDSGNNYNSATDRANFKGDSGTIRKPTQLSGGVEKCNYIPGYYRISYVNGDGSGNTGKFLMADRGSALWRQAFVLYKKHQDLNTFANDIYNNHPDLVSNIIYQLYYKNKGRYGEGCQNESQRFDDSCKTICTDIYGKDTSVQYYCNKGLINYSDNCRSGINRYSDNCKYTCDPKWTDSTLRENCNFGVSQDCNDYDHYKDPNNFTTCEASLANNNYTYPYTKLKDYCINEDNLHNDSICTNYQKNNDIYNRLKNDMNDICDLSKNLNNYSRCKTIIKRIDSLGDKFINWCKDNSSNEKCVDMLTSTDMSSLRDRYNNKLINDICSTGDKIITDSRCKNLLDSDNINIKNKAEDVLASYCNNNSKTFTLDPLVDNSCYRIANYKCSDTTLTDADKIKCNSYYTGILSKLETTTDVNNNVLYIFYDDNTFKRMPINYKFKSDISLTDADNPISLTTANKKTLIDIWTAKVFAFIQPDITGSYTFQVIGDDGVRFNINDKQLINNYPGYLGTQTTNAITLNKDLKYLFYFEFYENYGAAALNIKYKMNATDSFKDIPLTWYRPFKFNKTPDDLKNIFLNYMIAYPQNYFTDTNYKKKIDLINTDVIKSISDYCNVDYQKKDITTNCVKYVRNPMTYIRDNPNYDITKNDTSVSDANCTAWAVRGECDMNPGYMLNMCPKACAAANNNNIYNKLFLDRLQNSVGTLESSNYTNVYASDYILLELIPYLKKIYSNDLSKVYKYLKDNKIITPKLIYTAEINNNYTTNLFINKIYNMFKDIPDNTETSIANSYKGISINNCIDIKNIADSKCDSIRNDNSNYAVFTQPMYLYCNANENMNTDFCQTYYNNYNDKVSDINVQNKCATLSAFENDKNVIINNIELESFTDMPEKSVESDHNSNTLLLIFIIIISIIFAGLLFTKVGIEYRNYKKNKNRQNQKFMFS